MVSEVCRLQTADYRPQAADRKLQTAEYRSQTAYSRPQTVDYKMLTEDLWSEILKTTELNWTQITTLWPRKRVQLSSLLEDEQGRHTTEVSLQAI